MINRRLVLLCIFITISIISSSPVPPITFLATSTISGDDPLSMIPSEKLEQITRTHLTNDEGFRAAVYFLKSKEWRDLVERVMLKPEFEKFAQMCTKFKYNIFEPLRLVRDFVDSLDVPTKPSAEPSLGLYLKDMQAVLPIGDLIRYFNQGTSDHSAVGNKLRAVIGTKENREIVEALNNLPELVKMRKILKDMKFDVEPYIAMLFAFLGWA